MTTYTLNSYDPVKVVLPKPPVPQDMVEAEIERRLDTVAEYSIKEVNRQVQDDDYLAITIADSKRDGDPYPEFDAEGLVYHVGAGNLPDSFDNVLKKLKVGQSHEAVLGMDNPDSVSGQMSMITMNVTVDAILDCERPSLTDDFVAQTFPPATTVSEFRQMVVDSFQLEDMSPEDPNYEKLVAEELAKRLQEEPDEDCIRKHGSKEAARISCAMQALADHLGVGTTKDEIINNMPGEDADQKIAAFETFRQNGHEEDAVNMAREHMANSWVLAHSQVTYA